MAETKAPVVTEQPGPQAGMKKYQEVTGTEEWQSGIFDCFEGPDQLCLKATFCSCFVYGKTQHRLRDASLAGYERFNNDCLMFAGANACCGLGWILNFLKRGEVREKYAIKGDTVTDFALSFCCGCCSMIQVEKEVIGRQTGAGNGGYVAPAGMVAGPQ